MKIAYIILAHKNPLQVGRLINVLNTDDSIFAIHVDSIVPLNTFKDVVISKNPKTNNIYFLEKRYRTRWGGFNSIKATIELIGFVKSYEIDNIILLSGQDYPLKSNDSIRAYLKQFKNKVLFEYKLYDFADPNSSRINRYYFWDYFDVKKQSILPRLLTKIFMKRKFLRDVKPYVGRVQFVMPIEIAQYVHQMYFSNKKLTNYFKYVLCADELYFQTVIMNSKFSKQVENVTTHFADYSLANPIVWKSKDIDMLKQKDNLFARKFDIDVDDSILDLIDTHINNSKDY